MKYIYCLSVTCLVAGFIAFSSFQVMAGNPDRSGQAGATELLINPWAMSSGWGGAGSGGIRGVEAIFGNIAGIAATKGTEIEFSHSIWLKGSTMGINALGLTQKIGESSVLGLSLMSLDFGDIQVTTVDQPEGGLGTYSPQFINLGLSYAKIFSNSIYAGINLKIISESISNVNAQGVAIDAGIQYVTGTNTERDNLKFGITLKNVGTPMKFAGDGLTSKSTSQNPVNSTSFDYTVEQRTQGFEIPSLVNIGVMYDFKLAPDHRLSVAGTFTSNSFTNDQYILGLEYGFKEYFMIRTGYTYEDHLFDDALRTTVFTGPSAGFSLQLPLGKSSKLIGLDYSYRATKPFDGTHTFGIRFVL
jgi:hypothetical protein